ncbi:MAG TPA: branched-chain amino acid ABC transporter permease [Dehalococcoidia bacterium]|nr:branched-chain amino acid ABC transporter permease [Dehalococcoidia bacterium]
MAELIASQIFTGLVSGLLLVLVALGVTLIFGFMNVVNFAHGAFYMVGAYVGLVVLRATGSFWLALIAVPLALGAIGLVAERTLIRPLYRRTAHDPLLLTFGLTFVLIEIIRMIFGSVGVSLAAPDVLTGALNVGGYVFPHYSLFIGGVAIALVVALWLFLEKTDVGLIIRAGTQDSVMVEVLGIEISRYRMVVFGIGIAIAGLAGLLAAPRTGLTPDMGTAILIFAFVVVVIGGLGSYWGAVISGLLVGVVTSLTALFYPALAQIVVFVLMAVVLLVRPRGLLGTT